MEEYLKEKLGGNNSIERDLLIKGFEIGNAFALVDILKYIKQNPNISIDKLKKELMETIEITKYAKEIYAIKQ